ncbi:uncharacterized protein LOC143544552 isoform X1 [Bidens hawaiensis]|uniref:uncharacterized protein LOC143544552 isoform X1 n=1 Tax=Bidens hawaiensis TaxID=980011 RepID=UPI00404B2E59
MGAPEKTKTTTTTSNNNNNNSSMQRVKVYRLNDDGKWDDQGTGHVTFDYIEVRHNSRSEDLGLFVIDEEDNETLLVHRICSEDIYRKQEDTIISWRDSEYSSELALSFQETTGCSYIWDNICNVQRNLHFNTLSNETYHGANSELRELPEVELSSLPSILKVVVESSITDQLCVTELILHDQKFFRKLMDLFSVCEDLENYDGLHIIYKIVRGIILLNSPPIFEKIFSDELIMDIVGCLEYDPDSPHVHHRNYLKEHVVFKEAIPINDPLALSKIHQTYRISYLKDVVLPRVLDEATVASLNSIIHSNNGMVVTMLKDDNTFIKELFTRLKSPSVGPESKMNLVCFLQEFCNLSKSLQMVQQLRLFRDLVTEGVFDVIADILRSEDKKLILTGTDILMLFVSQDPTLLRSYVSRQEGASLIGLLVKGMLKDFGNDMHCQFLEIIRSLLDSYSPAGQRDAIVDIFYERHLDELLDVITSSCSNKNVGNKKSAKPEILLNIYDLLCFCVLQHPYKIKSLFLVNGVIDKILSLTCRGEKYLVVAAIRFIRTLVSLKDELLMNHIAKNNLFKPIVDVFFGNGSRYNLLNSAVLELFEYIRKENLKILVKYLVETFWEQLVKFDNLPSLQSLKVKYEQAMDQATSQAGPYALNARRRVDERALDKEEEDYFNEDSDEEDSASASMPRTTRVRSQPSLSNGAAANTSSISPRPGGLVDYEDDEDDEDYKPPPRNKSEDDDEAGLELRLKRKLSSSKQEPDSVKKQRQSGKTAKSKESVFATLCSTLSQAVKKTAIATNTQDTKAGPTDDKTNQDAPPNEDKEADKGGPAVATETSLNGS